MKAANISLDCSSWRKSVQNGKRGFEQNRVLRLKKTSDICKGLDVNYPANIATKFDLMCNKCGHA